MKTANKDINVYGSLRQAQRAFNKITSGHLLFANDVYFVDKSKTAFRAWPDKYTLIKQK